MDKDFTIWVDIARRKRRCHRCKKDVDKGAMFVRLGSKERPRHASCLCADCFNAVMIDMTQGFIELKKAAKPISPEGEKAVEGYRCPICGLEPEKCKCGLEAYR